MMASYLYSAHHFLSDADRHIQKFVSVRIEDSYCVTSLVMFDLGLFVAVGIKSYGELVAGLVANDQPKAEEVLDIYYLCE